MFGILVGLVVGGGRGGVYYNLDGWWRKLVIHWLRVVRENSFEVLDDKAFLEFCTIREVLI